MHRFVFTNRLCRVPYICLRKKKGLLEERVALRAKLTEVKV